MFIGIIRSKEHFAAMAFDVTSHYDSAIFSLLQSGWYHLLHFKKEHPNRTQSLRYGENPHQHGKFFGDLDDIFEQLHGKELSYNNLSRCRCRGKSGAGVQQ
jgi:phosphoribosylaminoimidazolecarboxamide formyltransferase/IMP cyclohydrolase